MNILILFTKDQRYKTSISEWYNNVAESAGVLAHELGHALGMQHDFKKDVKSNIRYDSKGNRCTGVNGMMDYVTRRSVNKFTTCSREDFAAWYQRVVGTYGSFCLSCNGRFSFYDFIIPISEFNANHTEE